MSWILLGAAVLAAIWMVAFAIWLVSPLDEVFQWLMTGRRRRRKMPRS